ncbi:MAG: VpsF family polysaccharide biosynthesis protein [Bauldia sp.]|nr:VpsF family polysaccharide biosynthesis protein [Bauldia sp.]
MTDITSNTTIDKPAEELWRQLLFWGIAFGLIGRLLLNNNVLDLFINYTSSGGSQLGKIHPASYLLLASGAGVVLSFRIGLTADEARIARALFVLLGAIVALLFWMVANGHATAAGYLVDTYLVAAVTGIAILAFPPHWRMLLGDVVLVILLASAMLGVVEAVMHFRLLPYPYAESTFRPTGLSPHPLALGLLSATAIGFVAATRWPTAWKIGVTLIFAVGTAAAGARIATLGAAAAIALIIALQSWPSQPRPIRLRLRSLAFVVGALMLPVVILGLFSFGFLGRFQGGLVDASSLARVDIYQVFHFFSWHDILFGTDIDKVDRIVNDQLDLEYIESSLIIFIFQFGLVATVFFVAVLATLTRALVRNAGPAVVIATLIFVVVALSNNTLSSKSPTVLSLIVLVLAFRRPSRGRQPGRVRQ